MTPTEYYASIKSLGLIPSNVPTVYFDSEGMTRSVPLPNGKTPEQIEEMLGKIKERLGLIPRAD